jgi:hypothetical protein
MEDLNPISEELKRLSANVRTLEDALFDTRKIDGLRYLLKTEEQRRETAERSATAWQETSRQNQLNADHYRDLVVKIGEMFGQEAKTQDDGGISEDVLCAKVLELVAKSIADARRYHLHRRRA